MKQKKDHKDLEAEEGPEVPEEPEGHSMGARRIVEEMGAWSQSLPRPKRPLQEDGCAWRCQRPLMVGGSFVGPCMARCRAPHLHQGEHNCFQSHTRDVPGASATQNCSCTSPSDLDLCECCNKLVPESSREKCRHCSHKACANCIRNPEFKMLKVMLKDADPMKRPVAALGGCVEDIQILKDIIMYNELHGGISFWVDNVNQTLESSGTDSGASSSHSCCVEEIEILKDIILYKELPCGATDSGASSSHSWKVPSGKQVMDRLLLDTLLCFGLPGGKDTGKAQGKQTNAVDRYTSGWVDNHPQCQCLQLRQLLSSKGLQSHRHPEKYSPELVEQDDEGQEKNEKEESEDDDGDEVWR